MREQIEPAAHNGGTKEEQELTHHEKESRPAIDQEGVVLCQCVRVVDVHEFDAKEHETNCTNESVVFSGGCLVFKELCRHHDNTLKQKAE